VDYEGSASPVAVHRLGRDDRPVRSGLDVGFDGCSDPFRVETVANYVG
jgi:hypothetical protein